MSAPYISYVKLNPDAPLDRKCFPGNLRFIPDLHLEFDRPVTFFVGENGSGKSTLLEAIAVLAGFPISGGGTNDVDASHGPAEESPLADAMRMAVTKQPRDGYFFRAELQAHFASLLDQRGQDPDFVSGNAKADPYQRYGGKSLHTMSHGEAFLSVMTNRFTEGLFLLDEPESALSPQRQLSLLTIMYDLSRRRKTQFIIATHSAILLTFPDARIISFDEERLKPVSLEETKHFQITSGILNSPESYWKHLRKSDGDE
jgi:predicted ATPase